MSLLITSVLYFALSITVNSLRLVSSLAVMRLSAAASVDAVDSNRFGQQVDARSLTKCKFQELYDGKIPVVLTHAFNCEIDNEAWVASLLKSKLKQRIEYDARHVVSVGTDVIDTYEAEFGEFEKSLYTKNDHYDNVYLMDENILNENMNPTPKQFQLNESIFGPDLFQFFPIEIRPKSALIMGGCGARSFLHADPFDWSGWNYLLRGRKLCKYNHHDAVNCC